MGLVVDTHSRFNIGRINEAEPGAACLIEPIRQEAHTVTLLHFQVFAVRFGDVRCRQTAQIMSIQENRHGDLQTCALLYSGLRAG
jgi:hypothetical protein